MDPTHNVPSIEEISFKLTENLIPSQLQLPSPLQHDDSLDYTLSRVSIQQLLLDHDHPDHPEKGSSDLDKLCSMKTTCAGTTEPSSIKKTAATTFRKRVMSSGKSASKSVSKAKIGRRLSQHTMNSSAHHKQNCNGLTLPLHSPHSLPFRIRENRLRCLSGQAFNSKAKEQRNDLFEMKGFLSVKPMQLEVDSVRQKIYMRKIIQNRLSVFPAVEEISQFVPCLTQRKGHRII